MQPAHNPALPELTDEKREQLVTRMLQELMGCCSQPPDDLFAAVAQLESAAYNDSSDTADYFHKLGSSSTVVKHRLIAAQAHPVIDESQPEGGGAETVAPAAPTGSAGSSSRVTQRTGGGGVMPPPPMALDFLPAHTAHDEAESPNTLTVPQLQLLAPSLPVVQVQAAQLLPDSGQGASFLQGLPAPAHVPQAAGGFTAAALQPQGGRAGPAADKGGTAAAHALQQPQLPPQQRQQQQSAAGLRSGSGGSSQERSSRGAPQWVGGLQGAPEFTQQQQPQHGQHGQDSRGFLRQRRQHQTNQQQAAAAQQQQQQQRLLASELDILAALDAGAGGGGAADGHGAMLQGRLVSPVLSLGSSGAADLQRAGSGPQAQAAGSEALVNTDTSLSEDPAALHAFAYGQQGGFPSTQQLPLSLRLPTGLTRSAGAVQPQRQSAPGLLPEGAGFLHASLQELQGSAGPSQHQNTVQPTAPGSFQSLQFAGFRRSLALSAEQCSEYGLDLQTLAGSQSQRHPSPGARRQAMRTVQQQEQMQQQQHGEHPMDALLASSSAPRAPTGQGTKRGNIQRDFVTLEQQQQQQQQQQVQQQQQLQQPRMSSPVQGWRPVRLSDGTGASGVQGPASSLLFEGRFSASPPRQQQQQQQSPQVKREPGAHPGEGPLGQHAPQQQQQQQQRRGTGRGPFSKLQLFLVEPPSPAPDEALPPPLEQRMSTSPSPPPGLILPSDRGEALLPAALQHSGRDPMTLISEILPDLISPMDDAVPRGVRAKAFESLPEEAAEEPKAPPQFAAQSLPPSFVKHEQPPEPPAQQQPQQPQQQQPQQQQLKRPLSRSAQHDQQQLLLQAQQLANPAAAGTSSSQLPSHTPFTSQQQQQHQDFRMQGPNVRRILRQASHGASSDGLAGDAGGGGSAADMPRHHSAGSWPDSGARRVGQRKFSLPPPLVLPSALDASPAPSPVPQGPSTCPTTLRGSRLTGGQRIVSRGSAGNTPQGILAWPHHSGMPGTGEQVPWGEEPPGALPDTPQGEPLSEAHLEPRPSLLAVQGGHALHSTSAPRPPQHRSHEQLLQASLTFADGNRRWSSSSYGEASEAMTSARTTRRLSGLSNPGPLQLGSRGFARPGGQSQGQGLEELLPASDEMKTLNISGSMLASEFLPTPFQMAYGQQQPGGEEQMRAQLQALMSIQQQQLQQEQQRQQQQQQQRQQQEQQRQQQDQRGQAGAEGPPGQQEDQPMQLQPAHSRGRTSGAGLPDNMLLQDQGLMSDLDLLRQLGSANDQDDDMDLR